MSFPQFRGKLILTGRCCHQILKSSEVCLWPGSGSLRSKFCLSYQENHRRTLTSRGDRCLWRRSQILNISQTMRAYASTNGQQSSNSVLVEDVVTTALQNFDLDKIRKEIESERKQGQENSLHFSARVKELVAKRCDELLANLGPEEQKKLKVIQLEHNFLYSEGNNILTAEQMLSQHWLEALKLSSRSQRLKYYIFLSKKHSMKLHEQTKKAAKREKAAAEENNADIEKKSFYEHGRLFFRIYESTMKRWENYRLSTAMQFGIPLVLDMDYSSFMRPQEIRNTANQLFDLYTINRASGQEPELPFHLHFTGCNADNSTFRLFELSMCEDPHLMATVSQGSYLDMFDKRQLVYLSPHARHTMKAFDPNAVYIVGAFNDKAIQMPLSYARAKEQNIMCQSFPLDAHLDWNLGSKNLTLDQTIKILIALKNKASWEEAFKAVPKRKIKNAYHSPNDQHMAIRKQPSFLTR